MITSFFKPKTQKVKPVSESDSSEKRGRDVTSAVQAPNPKRSKANNNEESSAEISEILSHLDHYESSSGGNSWTDVIGKLSTKSSFQRLSKFVSQERKSKNIFPPPHDIFSALNLTPLDKVKVVIVGQDPYHGPGQAHGLCFSVRKGVQIPPSLRNMYKELVQDEKISNFTSRPSHGFLERWAKQGVLMINTVLTVQSGKAHSHKNKGWEVVTDEIIRAVDRRSKSTGRGVVFLLWGKPATEKAKTALGGSSASRHRIICTSHPSPLGATKTKVTSLNHSVSLARASLLLVESLHNMNKNCKVISYIFFSFFI